MKLANECWAFIPARSGSKTIKNKNIKKLNKKPLIYYSLSLAKKCKVFKKIIFSSDSKTYLKSHQNTENSISIIEVTHHLPIQLQTLMCLKCL